MRVCVLKEEKPTNYVEPYFFQSCPALGDVAKEDDKSDDRPTSSVVQVAGRAFPKQSKPTK